MTLFTATDVSLDSFEFDGTEGLLRACKRRYGGGPMPTLDFRGRMHVGRTELIDFLVENVPEHTNGSRLLSPQDPKYQTAIDWFHEQFLPPGVESTIYTVNQTLVTVHATYLLPEKTAAIAAGGADGDGAGDSTEIAAVGGGKGDETLAKLMADSATLA